jgi:cytochrome c oxidase subunit 3
MLLLVGAEVMFFLGLISAFTISRAGTRGTAWALPGAALPVESTALNTLALFASGALVYVAHRQFGRESPAAGRTLVAAWLLGTAFVLLQGREWWQLLGDGLTMRSSKLGAFFYLIVGAHALHAVGALVGLGLACWHFQRGTLSRSFFLGAATFWYFVVGVWPLIYWRVYF